MINLCKCCFLIEKESGGSCSDLKDIQGGQEDINETDEQVQILEEQRKLSDHFEEDSGTCVDQASSAASNSENMLETCIQHPSDSADKVQLTVSSVNSILPDLLENDVLEVNEQEPLLIKHQPRTVPLVILAASKRHQTTPNSSTESVKKPVLKKPKPNYTRQCSAPTTTTSNSSTLVTPPISQSSSRRNSGDGRKRDRSPCVSFDADVVVHEADGMRARSRSDASSRFKGKIDWLRNRRNPDLMKFKVKDPIAEDDSAGAVSSMHKSQAHRPRTRSDSKWLKISRKKAVENGKHEKISLEWPPMRSKWRKQKAADVLPETEKMESNKRSQSVAGLTNHEVDKVVSSKLKRQGSERAKKSVAFETTSSWWNSSVKLLIDMTKSGKNKTARRRHASSDSRKTSGAMLKSETIFHHSYAL